MHKLNQHRHAFLFIWYILLFYIFVTPIASLVQNIYFTFDPLALSTFEQLLATNASEAQLMAITAMPSALINLVVYTLAAVPMFALLHDELNHFFEISWQNKRLF
ncbi:MAG: hypothetical protein ACRCZG_06090, partial [Culicoidibacterales bacterium]